MLAIQARNANRETFRDADMVRFHGISSRGGGVGAGIGIGGTPTRSKLRKRIVFERSHQRVLEFQSFE